MSSLDLVFVLNPNDMMMSACKKKCLPLISTYTTRISSKSWGWGMGEWGAGDGWVGESFIGFNHTRTQ